MDIGRGDEKKIESRRYTEFFDMSSFKGFLKSVVEEVALRHVKGCAEDLRAEDSHAEGGLLLRNAEGLTARPLALVV